jgi:hypothetical protein
MYTIFFTINCVEQLIFSKTFVDHLQFEQLIFFCLKVKLLESSWFAKINWIRAVDKKNNYCSNGVEQMKNRVEQIFWANKFWADDHDPVKVRVSQSKKTNKNKNKKTEFRQQVLSTFQNAGWSQVHRKHLTQELKVNSKV